MVERFLEQFPAIQASPWTRFKKSMEKDRLPRDTHTVFVLKDSNIRQFLEEGKALDPRFKSTVADKVWTRLGLQPSLEREREGPQNRLGPFRIKERACDQDDSSFDKDSASAATTLKRPSMQKRKDEQKALVFNAHAFDLCPTLSHSLRVSLISRTNGAITQMPLRSWLV
ncbi:hypothetical protein HF521_022311 [Silurus meridionalis]|uniref:Uncharacterized protein n=1 Tax=Silurus meridionalis TaxID=175797 RepID=A0A8T0B8S5_SILME|nr:hypothetical protein HF521_022311 [Silurus meridionalis]